MDIAPDRTALAGLITDANPMGTDGFAFLEFSAPHPGLLEQVFSLLGFSPLARHRSKRIALWQQGEIDILLNHEQHSFAAAFSYKHGPSCCGIGFRVADAKAALARAIAFGATPLRSEVVGPLAIEAPALEGIGGSALYLVDSQGTATWKADFEPLTQTEPHTTGAGLTVIDHLTHNVYRGRMEEWAGFYERIFNFRPIRYFDIEGKLTGLRSKALTSPCGLIRIPINESTDEHSQIEEYLRLYKGEGVQHVAFGTQDIYRSVEFLRERGVRFLDTPDTYYELLPQRLPESGEDLQRLARNRILMDGSPSGGRLLQIFTATMIGPIFFELIQRKGDQGFGEGNFRALFESMELDQIRRGVLKPEAAA